ncbi:acetyltransferase (GNAT) family protein [Kribbella steppae]|uniref:Acetyltransferase (GNAT) family protein n=1 Tax=Kribbella steppae TaxID=2512223 RepID=A0A4R2HNB5_9ACTN|nr:GNAT family N-acetyltransferase [Kribbella steppae]TCO30091.1 acetyltransferase (GNAT) family protein [Kribbella steppae]
MIDVLDVQQSLGAAPELAAVYLSAFGAPGYDEDAARAEEFGNEQLPLHSQRDGFKLVAARSDDRIVGFAYGFTGQRGQWWSERVAEAAPAEIVEEWVGGHFEIVDLAVMVEAQGQGLGSALHDVLMADLPHERALLTTWADDRPAPRLYRRKGWQVLVPDLGWGSALYGLRLR